MELAQPNITNKILIICGLTATGKTKLAIEIAKKCNGELISADSRQVYKEMTILSGKDIPKNVQSRKSHITVRYNYTDYPLVTYDFNGVPMWMYDLVSITEPFSVAQYVSIAGEVFADIQRRGKLPIIVGGTGFYIRGLTKSAETFSVPPDLRLRKSLDILSVAELQTELQALDAQKYNSMNPSDRNNPRRLIRAIEVARWRKKYPKDILPSDNYKDNLIIGLRTSLDQLEPRIQQRVKQRLSGAIKEVKNMMKFIIPLYLPSQSAIGISLIEQYLNGTIVRRDLVREWTQEEFRYAKRQMTWFKKMPSIHWYDIENSNFEKEIVSLVSTWYT